MASFIYFYSKFTEELLLLSAAGVFTFLSIYCYHWVIKKRRLGAARDQIPAGMVKIYLNQLIGEAQFVRTQLFGLLNGGEIPKFNPGVAPVMPKMNLDSRPELDLPPMDLSQLPPELAERIKALEGQLREKESIVVNVNVEKSKLLEEIENLKQNQKALANAGASDTAASEELVNKIKGLEQRLEEYSVFEEDLANLKRLQQENTDLKKRIEELLRGQPGAPVAEPQVAAGSPDVQIPAAKRGLDKAAVENLLDGVPAVPPTTTAKTPPPEMMEPMPAPTPIKAAPPPPAPEVAAGPTPTLTPPAAAAPPLPPAPEALKETKKPDDFEKLVDKVESSLNKPAPVAAAPAAPQAPKKDEAVATKSDEELLKEFENLLNS